MTDTTKPWGRLASLGLGFVAMMAGQIGGLLALTWWYDLSASQLSSLGGDGGAVTLIIIVSTPIQVALLWLFAQRAGNAADYLGLTMPRRSELIVGVLAIIALIVVSDAVSWLLGRGLVTSFQTDIYRTAGTEGLLPLLWLAVVVVAPIGEETLFRGFLFRGWLHAPRDAWPVIVATALLFAVLHVQYDLFVIAQVFVFGLLLGWMRWASGSTILTMALHMLINFEGMLETYLTLNN
jgi:hypothetical protein